MRGPVVLLLVLLSLPPSAATAQQKSKSEALIERGLDLREQGKDAEALELFKEAHGLEPSARAQVQMALALQALGRWVEAEESLKAALENKSDKWIGKNRKPLEAALSNIAERLGTLEILGSPAGAEVKVGGKPVGKLPLATPIRVVAGTVVVDVSAEAHWPVTRTVQVGARAFARENIELVKREAEPVASVPAETSAIAVRKQDSAATSEPARETETKAGPPPSSPSVSTSAPKSEGETPVLTYALGGVAAAGIATGVIALVVRNGAVADWNDDSICLVDGKTREENCADRRSKAKTMTVLAGVGFGVGLAAAVGAGLSLLLGGEESAQASRGSTGERAVLAFAGCEAGDFDLGVSCGFRF